MIQLLQLKLAVFDNCGLAPGVLETFVPLWGLCRGVDP